MVTVKCYLNGEEIAVFDRGKTKDGDLIFRWYFRSHIPPDFHGVEIEDPDDNTLLSIAYGHGEVRKEYSVDDPSELDWTLGVYIYLPDGRWIHCDPIPYGCDEDEEIVDISRKTADFMSKYHDYLVK